MVGQGTYDTGKDIVFCISRTNLSINIIKSVNSFNRPFDCG
jgi:hypothetical protein